MLGMVWIDPCPWFPKMETEREEEREKETTTEVWEAVGEEAVKGRCGVVARRGGGQTQQAKEKKKKRQEKRGDAAKNGCSQRISQLPSVI